MRFGTLGGTLGLLLTSTLVGCADPELDPLVRPAPICVKMVECWFTEGNNHFAGLEEYESLAHPETEKNIRTAFGPTGTCWTDDIGAYRCAERCLQAVRDWCEDPLTEPCDQRPEDACNIMKAIDDRRGETAGLRAQQGAE